MGRRERGGQPSAFAGAEAVPGLSGRSCPRPPRLGREWPGGGRRAERVGRSRLSPSAERLARAGEQMVAVLSCPLGRRTSDLPWAPRVVTSSPHTETPVPEGQCSPLPTFRRGKGVGPEKGFSKALAAGRGVSWRAGPCSSGRGAVQGPRSASRPLGHSRGMGTHLEGPKGSEKSVDAAPARETR